MSNLEYSNDALNAMSAFYRAKAMVYVEGDDDVIFWRHILSETIGPLLEIEPVGGVGEIKKYVDKILAGEIDAVVARDADLSHFVGPQSRHPRILYSYGYSIENSLYTVPAIKGLAESWSKTDRLELNICTAWIDDLLTAVTPLIELDIANALEAGGLETIGDNCTRFMTSTSSDRVCRMKVESYSDPIKLKIATQNLASARAILESASDASLRLIRGHFLASAIMKFIVSTAKRYGKKVSLSAESLYAAAIGHFGNSVKTAQHPHYEYYKALSENLAAQV